MPFDGIGCRIADADKEIIERGSFADTKGERPTGHEVEEEIVFFKREVLADKTQGGNNRRRFLGGDS